MMERRNFFYATLPVYNRIGRVEMMFFAGIVVRAQDRYGENFRFLYKTSKQMKFFSEEE